MTTTQISDNGMSKVIQEALVDKLRACHSKEEILDFEKAFNSGSKIGPLYEVICNFLRNRSISRGLAAKWLSTLIQDKEDRLSNT